MCVPNAGRAADVSVFAAASLAEVMEDIGRAFEAASGHKVVLTLAGSSALARQIEYGAPADVFVSANTAWVSHLNDRLKLEPEGTQTLYGNELVIVVPRGELGDDAEDTALMPKDVLAEGRVAMALVEAVPAGIYGRQALENMGLWEGVASRVVQVDNVRAALSLVALGAVGAGIVYETDALAEPRVQIAARFSADLHDPIVYPAAIVAGQDRPEVLEFLSFWESAAARDAFEKRGFRVLEERE